MSQEQRDMRRREQQLRYKNDLDNQLRYTRRIKEAFDYLHTQPMQRSPLLSSKDLDLNRPVRRMIGSGIFVSNNANPFDRSAANIGTLTEQQTIAKLQEKMLA